MSEHYRFVRVGAADGAPLLDGLCQLLIDTVADGASIGFLAPLSVAEAQRYWLGVFDQVLTGSTALWVALAGQRVAGTVQLAPCLRANGRNRAEVQKLMVAPADRGQGLASRLMAALETGARLQGLGVLFLDTEAWSRAERFYQMQGYSRVGEIPDYATSPDGRLHATAIYYKRLTASPRTLVPTSAERAA